MGRVLGFLVGLLALASYLYAAGELHAGVMGVEPLTSVIPIPPDVRAILERAPIAAGVDAPLWRNVVMGIAIGVGVLAGLLLVFGGRAAVVLTWLAFLLMGGAFIAHDVVIADGLQTEGLTLLIDGGGMLGVALVLALLAQLAAGGDGGPEERLVSAATASAAAAATSARESAPPPQPRPAPKPAPEPAPAPAPAPEAPPAELNASTSAPAAESDVRVADAADGAAAEDEAEIVEAEVVEEGDEEVEDLEDADDEYEDLEDEYEDLGDDDYDDEDDEDSDTSDGAEEELEEEKS